MRNAPPIGYTWQEFMRGMGLSKEEADDMPDIDLYRLYVSYQLRLEAGVPLDL